MKIEAVKLMRNIREQMSQEIKGMEWREEQEYLRNHIQVFKSFAKDVTQKALHPDDNSLSSRAASELGRLLTL